MDNFLSTAPGTPTSDVDPGPLARVPGRRAVRPARVESVDERRDCTETTGCPRRVHPSALRVSSHLGETALGAHAASLHS